MMRSSRSILTFCAGLLLCPITAVSQPNDTEAAVRAYLPPGEFTVDAMDVQTSPRHTELAQRLQAAMQREPAFFQEMVRRAAPGEPLAYDARMGISRGEYAEFLGLARTPTLAKVASAPLVVRREGRRLVFDGGRGLPDLTGVAIDLDDGSLSTPLGRIGSWERVRNDDAVGGMGAWEGIRWEAEEMTDDQTTGSVVSLLIARLASGRGAIYWQMRRIENGIPTMRIVRILYFDPPPT